MAMKVNLRDSLNNKIKVTLRFINEVLYPHPDTTKSLLDEFKVVLLDFQKENDLNVLRKLREIDSRPVPEGAKTDFTTGMSLRMDGEYTSLGELILDIEDLVFKIEGGES